MGERGGSTLWYEVSNSSQWSRRFPLFCSNIRCAIGWSKSLCNIVSEKGIFLQRWQDENYKERSKEQDKKHEEDKKLNK
jgi:hypothetical protein